MTERNDTSSSSLRSLLRPGEFTVIASVPKRPRQLVLFERVRVWHDPAVTLADWRTLQQ
jgi:hypothetical protein